MLETGQILNSDYASIRAPWTKIIKSILVKLTHCFLDRILIYEILGLAVHDPGVLHSQFLALSELLIAVCPELYISNVR